MLETHKEKSQPLCRVYTDHLLLFTDLKKNNKVNNQSVDMQKVNMSCWRSDAGMYVCGGPVDVIFI